MFQFFIRIRRLAVSHGRELIWLFLSAVQAHDSWHRTADTGQLAQDSWPAHTLSSVYKAGDVPQQLAVRNGGGSNSLWVRPPSLSG